MTLEIPGHKDDGGKSRLDLIVPGWLWEVGHVLAHGAKKYGPNNWQKVEPARYHAAILRHALAYQDGQTYDPETGLHHQAHLACSSMFLFWHDRGQAIADLSCRCSKCTGYGQHPTHTILGG